MLPQIVPQATTTNHYHKFCSNPTLFKFDHKFTTHLPQTTTINPYHNHSVNIYYHTNLFFQSDNFSILPHILSHIFTTDITTNFTTNYYHKPLSYWGGGGGGSISTTTPIFVPIQQFFNFTTNFATHFKINVTTNH